jgi:hypothetical protein
MNRDLPSAAAPLRSGHAHWTAKKCPLKEKRSPGARLKPMPLLASIVLPGNHPAEGKNAAGIRLLLKEMEYWEISSSGGTLTPA